MKSNREQLVDRLIETIEQGDLEGVRFLVQSGADVNYISSRGISPLCTACRLCHDDIVKLLLAAGADANLVDDGDDYKKTPLHIAAFMSDVNAMKYLIAAGARVNTLDGKNFTPLDYAIKSGSQSTINQLKKVNAISGERSRRFAEYKNPETIPLLETVGGKRVPNAGYMSFFNNRATTERRGTHSDFVEKFEGAARFLVARRNSYKRV